MRISKQDWRLIRMKCGNCKLWDTQTLYGTESQNHIKQSYKEWGQVLGACTYQGHFYPRFNHEICPFDSKILREKTS